MRSLIRRFWTTTRPHEHKLPDTVVGSLHRLWSNTSPDGIDKREAKRLWVVLQNFVEEHGGREALSAEFDTL